MRNHSRGHRRNRNLFVHIQTVEGCTMKIATGMLAAAVLAISPAFPATNPPATGDPAQMVITVLPAGGSKFSHSPNLEAGDVTVMQDKTPARVVRLQRLTGDLAGM